MAEDGADDMETLLDTLANNYAAFSGTASQKRPMDAASDGAAPWRSMRRKRQGGTETADSQIPSTDDFDEGEDLDAVLALPVEAPEDGVDSYDGSNMGDPDEMGEDTEAQCEGNNATLVVANLASSDYHVTRDELIGNSELAIESFEGQLNESESVGVEIAEGLSVGADIFDGLEEELGVEAFDVYTNPDSFECGATLVAEPEVSGVSDSAINGVEPTVEAEAISSVDAALVMEDPGTVAQPEIESFLAAGIDGENREDINDDEDARLAEIIAGEFGSLLKRPDDAEDVSSSALIASEEKGIDEKPKGEQVSKGKADDEEKLLAEEAMQAMLCGDAAKYEELNKKLVEIQATKARLAERKLEAKAEATPVQNDVVGTFVGVSQAGSSSPPMAFENMSSSGAMNLGGNEFLHEFEALRELATFTSSSSTSAPIQELEVQVLDSYGMLIEDSPRYTSFVEPIFPISIMTELLQAGFSRPTSIQQYAWPLALQMRDIIGIASTGSGKTLAFLLPAFSHILQHSLPPSAPTLLVVAPTRELAVQIDTEAKRFGVRSGLRTACCYGGTPRNAQAVELQIGVHGVIGTPGRLNDFLDSGQLNVQYVTKLVVDEADRMLDMGFEPQLRSIVKRVPEQRQTLFFTATWPAEVQRVASEFLRDAYRVQVGQVDVLTGNQDITQIVKICRGRTKPQMLTAALIQAGVVDPTNLSARGLVFCNTKRLCDSLAQQLSSSGVPCNAIHGDKDQRQREWALNDLKTGRIKLLVATDVAARGLDIRGVNLVINYDAPAGAEDYVHRIGRTGRAGQRGFALSLISDYDMWVLPAIVQVMRETGQFVSPQVEYFARNPRPRRDNRIAARLERNREPVQPVPSLSSVSSQLGHRSRSRERIQQPIANPVTLEPTVSEAVAVSSSNVEICD